MANPQIVKYSETQGYLFSYIKITGLGGIGYHHILWSKKPETGFRHELSSFSGSNQENNPRQEILPNQQNPEPAINFDGRRLTLDIVAPDAGETDTFIVYFEVLQENLSNQTLVKLGGHKKNYTGLTDDRLAIDLLPKP